MMNKYVKFYFKILPFYSLLAIVFSILRTAFHQDLSLAILAIGSVLDFGIICHGRKYLINKSITFLIIILFLSLSIGLLNGNEISRRYITDFMYPLFFFSKIIILSNFWKNYDFKTFLNYYIKISLWGSIALLPLTYYLFHLQNVNRLAIFPPMELPLSYFMQSGGLLLLISILVIFLYGKRAQLVGAIGVLLVYSLYFNRKDLFKYAFIFLLLISLGLVFMIQYKDNLAVRRLNYTIEKFTESDSNKDGIGDISAGRDDEIALVVDKLTISRVVFGFGLGMEISHSDANKDIGNIHFSPLSFIMKYGVVFTFFLYAFILGHLRGRREILKSLDKSYIAALGTILFIFIESLFSYALFVMPIFSVAFSYVRYRNLTCKK